MQRLTMEWVPRWLWRPGFIRAKLAEDGKYTPYESAQRETNKLKNMVQAQDNAAELQRLHYTGRIETIGRRKNLWKQRAKTAEQELQWLKEKVSTSQQAIPGSPRQ